MTGARKHLALLAMVCVLVYANSFWNDFVWDDQALVTANSYLPDWRNVPTLFTTNLFAGAGRESAFYRPIQALTFMVDYHIWGKRPFGYHLTNMLLHLANAMLLYVLIAPIASRRAAIIASLLFVAHPLQTEAITYISGRADPLALCFLLVALLCYRKAWAHPGAGLWRLASLAAFFLALLSKEMALIFPALLVLYDLTTDPVARPRALLERFGRRYAPYLVIMGLYGGLRRLLPDLYLVPEGGVPLSLGQRLLLSLRVFGEYLGLLAVPRDLHMERSVPVPTSLLTPQVLVGALGLLLMIGLACWAWPRVRPLTLGVGWFILGFLPISNLIPLNAYMAEHWMYLPGIGLFIAVGLAIDAVADRLPQWWPIGLFSIILLYAGSAIGRNRDWKDEATFYTLTLKHAPESWRVRANLGNMYLSKGQLDQAVEIFQSAQRLNPFDLVSYLGMGEAYEKLGRDQEAIEQYGKALLIYPRAARAHLQLAKLYVKIGEKDRAAEHYEAAPQARVRSVLRLTAAGDRHMQGRRYGEAAEVYKQAIELSPSDADLRSKLGLAYAAMGEGERAKREYERALKVNPASLNARNYLGAYFMQKSLWEQAVEQFQEVIRLAPEHADARNNLGISYYQLGKMREAEAELRKALALRPGSKEIKENLEKVTAVPAATSLARLEQEVRSQADSARAHYELGSAYGNMGELEKASREFAIALRLDPRNPVIHYAIGVLHYTKGERDQAQLAWQRAIRLDPTFGPARERLAELRATGPAARRGP